MERLKFKFLTIILWLLPSLSFATAPYIGANFSYAAIGREPEFLQGYQLMLNFDPQRYKWRHFNVYFDGGFSHFWVTNTTYHKMVNIFSAAPVVRYTFRKRWFFIPYLEISIGVAYLSNTRIDDRNLGMHYSFQDRMGVGIFCGASKQLSVGIHSVHYSNAHLSGHNSGITVPLAIDVGYRFQL